jgi:hypothetical protein
MIPPIKISSRDTSSQKLVHSKLNGSLIKKMQPLRKQLTMLLLKLKSGVLNQIQSGIGLALNTLLKSSEIHFCYNLIMKNQTMQVKEFG